MIDKSWIEKPINLKEFLDEVVQFLDFAFSNASINGQILCPCIICGFHRMLDRNEMFSHLLQQGFPRKYTSWYMHGEKYIKSVSQVQEEPVRQYPMQDMLNDVFGVFVDNGIQDSSPSNIPNSDHSRGTEDASKEELEKIKELLRDENQDLYNGCTKYNKLSFIVRLYHVKVLCGAPDKTFSMIIELLYDAYPYAKLPTSFYEGKKMIKRLKTNENGGGENDLTEGKKKKKPQPENVLRYFPLIPRLKRLYMCFKTAELLKWHAMGANPDGLLRHPRGSKAWKEFDLLYPDFASENGDLFYLVEMLFVW
ncbi:uncharacterized protein LOC133317320 [Gastrolobium bilobum]|uniref:uncharacterized protein LOC133317320 n=1 Tax=Gastrolobium bilobum TaxID=150636 RepID=UPI002AB0E233|nr:uncharacterized protein LOC133317320 [Gastrolobium bilobum]